MAARIRKLALTDNWRDGIRAGVVTTMLYKHVSGDREMSATQVKAAQILLAKLITDLARTEITGDGGGPVMIVASSADERL